VNKPTIGIRQADGSFYGIMEDSGTPRKRLILSAARAEQHSVKIDLYRSTDGLIEDATLVGSLDLMSDESLEFQDIGFEISIDEAGQLSAEAALPSGETSSIDVDLAEFRNEKRSDADILADSGFDADELDDIGAFGSLDEPASEFGENIPDDGDNVVLDLPDFEAEPALESEPSFDMDDLDAGFGADEAEELMEPVAEVAAESDDESWHDFSMDDMEPMEFLDTGDEISAPKTPPAGSSAPAKKPSRDEFSMDDEAPLELGDFDDDLDMGSLDGLDDSFPKTDSDAGFASDPGFDEDFLPPPELADEKAFATAAKAEKKAAQKQAASRPAKAAKVKAASSGGGSLDKTALVLSLITLSLLVVTLIVLLLLNMIRPPQAPQIKPEVMQWKSVAPLAAGTKEQPTAPAWIDLGDPATWPIFEATTVSEVPAALTGPQIVLRLDAGETATDATRRFGPPDRIEGEQLFW